MLLDELMLHKINVGVSGLKFDLIIKQRPESLWSVGSQLGDDEDWLAVGVDLYEYEEHQLPFGRRMVMMLCIGFSKWRETTLDGAKCGDGRWRSVWTQLHRMRGEDCTSHISYSGRIIRADTTAPRSKTFV
jgi:hypothetical protein